ncbi:MAG: DNA-3-methyladenine glycosylase [Opitutae bacterium]|nr:DNA-3-methyladenine glycosylase [Opitutae bacterium]
MGRLIQAKELQGKNTVAFARRLLGCALVRTLADGRQERHLIAETEAYNGWEDRASHASRGRTPRNAPMFAAGGIWYVYLCYGVHEMLNLVTGPEGFPAAVLIRGVTGITGPGRLTKALGIDRQLNGAPVAPASGLHLEESVTVPARWIQRTPRIGVDYAGPEWAGKLWRFRVDAERLLKLAAEKSARG